MMHDPTYATINTEQSNQAMQDLTFQEKDMFVWYMFGGASAHLSPKRWQSLVDEARRHVLARRALLEEVKK